MVFAYSESKLTCHFVLVVIGTKGLKNQKKVEKGCLQLIKGNLILIPSTSNISKIKY